MLTSTRLPKLFVGHSGPDGIDDACRQARELAKTIFRSQEIQWSIDHVVDSRSQVTVAIRAIPLLRSTVDQSGLKQLRISNILPMSVLYDFGGSFDLAVCELDSPTFILHLVSEEDCRAALTLAVRNTNRVKRRNGCSQRYVAKVSARLRTADNAPLGDKFYMGSVLFPDCNLTNSATLTFEHIQPEFYLPAEAVELFAIHYEDLTFESCP